MTIFSGRLDGAKLSWFRKQIAEKVKFMSGDVYDWAAIAAWAIELPAKIDV